MTPSFLIVMTAPTCELVCQTRVVVEAAVEADPETAVLDPGPGLDLDHVLMIEEIVVILLGERGHVPVRTVHVTALAPSLVLVPGLPLPRIRH